MDLTLSLIFSGAVLFLVYLFTCYSYWRGHGIPISKGLIPLVGHMLPLLTLRSNMTHILTEMYRDNPNVSMVGFYKLTRPALLIRDPGLVKTILQSNFSSFHKNGSQVNPKTDTLLSEHPFFTYGEVWMFSRKRLKYAFSGTRIRSLFESITGVCGKFVDFLEKQLQTSDTYEVELKYLFSKFTGEVMANAGLGIDGHCFDAEGKQPFSFEKLGTSVFTQNLTRMFSQSIIFFMPELHNVLKAQFVPEEVGNFFRTAVREALKTRKHETVPRNDFFQLMVRFLKRNDQEIDEEVLVAHAVSFFLDGYETTSVTLSYVGYHIATHSDIQRKVREEVLSVLSKHNGALTYESLKEMSYLQQVVNESQRRYDTVGVMNKICTQECELRGSDGLCLRVKPGTEIYMSIYALQMDPEYWENPEKFDPERFSESRKQNIDPFAFLPFGRGPRICSGEKLAILQIKACIATLVKNYSLELSPKMKLPITISPHHFLSVPIGGYWAYVRRI